jgi:hypothetical protein
LRLTAKRLKNIVSVRETRVGVEHILLDGETPTVVRLRDGCSPVSSAEEDCGAYQEEGTPDPSCPLRLDVDCRPQEDQRQAKT